MKNLYRKNVVSTIFVTLFLFSPQAFSWWWSSKTIQLPTCNLEKESIVEILRENGGTYEDLVFFTEKNFKLLGPEQITEDTLILNIGFVEEIDYKKKRATKTVNNDKTCISQYPNGEPIPRGGRACAHIDRKAVFEYRKTQLCKSSFQLNYEGLPVLISKPVKLTEPYETLERYTHGISTRNWDLDQKEIVGYKVVRTGKSCKSSELLQDNYRKTPLSKALRVLKKCVVNTNL